MITDKKPHSSSSKDVPINLSLRTTAKLLKIAPQRFNQLLADHGFIFKNKSQNTWEAYCKITNQGLLINEEILIRHTSYSELVPHLQVKVTPKGYHALKQLFEA